MSLRRTAYRHFRRCAKNTEGGPGRPSVGADQSTPSSQGILLRPAVTRNPLGRLLRTRVCASAASPPCASAGKKALRRRLPCLYVLMSDPLICLYRSLTDLIMSWLFCALNMPYAFFSAAVASAFCFNWASATASAYHACPLVASDFVAASAYFCA